MDEPMPAPRLHTALTSFSRSIKDARELANDAHKWSIPLAPGARAQITLQRRDTLTEMAFLRAFTSWEVFLEQAFVLYLLGHRPPKGAPPRRYGFPPTPAAAAEWCLEGRNYAKWNAADVQRKANQWFKDGKPFTPILQARQSHLKQLVTIRNAIAHESSEAKAKFEALVRDELGALPPGTSVGNFLMTTKPTSTPPISFMEFYLTQIEGVAMTIVPK
jgi:hypothetical protein